MNIKFNTIKNINWFFDIVNISKKPMYWLVFINVILGVYFALSALVLRKLVNGAASKNKEVLLVYTIVFLVMIISKILISAIFEYLNSTYVQRLEYAFKTKFFNKILNSEYKDFSKYHSSRINYILTFDIPLIVSLITNHIPLLANSISQITSVAIAIFILNKKIGLTLLVAGLFTVSAGSFINNKIIEYHETHAKVKIKSDVFTQEIFSNLVSIKSNLITDRFSKLVKRFYLIGIKSFTKKLKTDILLNYVTEIAFKIIYVSIILWCIVNLLHRTLNIGTFSAMILLTTRLQAPFLLFIKNLQKMTRISKSVEKIKQVYQIKQDVLKLTEDKNTIIQKYNSSENGISIKNLTFRYSPESNLIFENTNLTLEKNKFYALKGNSGIGKTTLFHLLLALFNVDSGMIKVGDMDVSPNTRYLFSYVPQIPCIFTGELKDYITLYDKSISIEKINQALKLACADEFVENLPAKLHTEVGERGFGLSFGQCQRLAISQAILKDAPILILDEACSGIDAKTEIKILQNLKKLENKTIIAISHQNYISDICDKEILLENKSLIIK